MSNVAKFINLLDMYLTIKTEIQNRMRDMPTLISKNPADSPIFVMQDGMKYDNGAFGYKYSEFVVADDKRFCSGFAVMCAEGAGSSVFFEYAGYAHPDDQEALNKNREGFFAEMIESLDHDIKRTKKLIDMENNFVVVE